MPEWKKAPDDVVKLATGLIEAHHPHLAEARIGIIMRDEAARQGGRLVLGKAMKVDSKYGPLLKRELDFVIWLAEDEWQGLSPQARRALVDHELCHCWWGKNGWTIRPHDVEEFVAVVRRHGLWRFELEKLNEAAKEHGEQPPLPFETSTNGEVVALGPDDVAAAILEGAALGMKQRFGDQVDVEVVRASR